jgi:2-desacetyl-2-hydroxyethyl bacteriochlorophyllide A dehydrogenase
MYTGKRQIELQTIELPPPAPGEVRVKTLKTMISIGTEMTLYNREFPAGSRWEEFADEIHSAGYIGVVEVIGAGSEEHKGLLGKHFATPVQHQAYANLNAEYLYPMEYDNLSEEEALFFCLAQIALRGIRRSEVKLGDNAVVYGAGIIGYLSACFCKICGADNTFVVDTSEFRLGLLPKDNSIIPINPKKQEPDEVVKEFTKGRMADMVFELTGNHQLIPTEFKVLRDLGKMIIVSSPRGTTEFNFHDLCNGPSYTIIGSHNKSHPAVETSADTWTPRRHCELFFSLVDKGRLNVKNLITHEFSYKEAGQVYRKISEDRSEYMGVILNWD